MHITLHEIHAILMRADYPASKRELIAFVHTEGYPEEVARRLEAIPEHEYGSVDTVMDTLGHQD